MVGQVQNAIEIRHLRVASMVFRSDGYQVILLQSSTSSTCIPVLKHLIGLRSRNTAVFCLLYPPACLIGTDEDILTFDLTSYVPGYQETQDISSIIAEKLKSLETTSHIVIDSLETLVSDIGSTTTSYTFLKTLLSEITSKNGKSWVLVL